MESMESDHVIKWYGASLFLMPVINQAAKRIWGSTVLQGLPMWNWKLCVFWQTAIFLPLLFWAWYLAGFDPNWIYLGPGDYPGSEKALQVYLIVMWAYLVKDFFCTMDLKYFIHHVVCMVASIAFWFFPGGLALFCVGATILEVGSCSQSVWFLKPSKWAEVYHLTVMTISNIIAICLAFFVYLPNDVDPLYLRWLFCIGIIVMTLSRQAFCFDNCNRLLSGWLPSVFKLKENRLSS